LQAFCKAVSRERLCHSHRPPRPLTYSLQKPKWYREHGPCQVPTISFTQTFQKWPNQAIHLKRLEKDVPGFVTHESVQIELRLPKLVRKDCYMHDQIAGMLSKAKLAPPNSNQLTCLCQVDMPPPAQSPIVGLRCLVVCPVTASLPTLD
jgi:hypothetical protein